MPDKPTTEKNAPYVLAETARFAVVFKPPRMHCAPPAAREPSGADGDALLDWYAGRFPQVAELNGRKPGEGGLLHRLDFETRGLVLFAKSQTALESLLAQQAEGNFVKDYSAICQRAAPGQTAPASFPPAPAFRGLDEIARGGAGPRDSPPAPPPPSRVSEWRELPVKPFSIGSFFRPFGPGRKEVRPAVCGGGKRTRGEIARDRGGLYRTEILGVSARGADETPESRGFLRFALRLRRGFRHQARCHLAWIGHPILNDPLYGPRGESRDGFIALSADGLSFLDPESGEPREYRVAPLELRAISL